MDIHSSHIPQKIGLFDHHGFVVPLFSLRSKNSAGIGEYLDLLPVIDLCSDCGFDIIQTLPLNDSDTNSSPYSAITAFGLHPIYLSLWALPQLSTTLKKRLTAFHEKNTLQRFDYDDILQSKLDFLYEYFTETFSSYVQSNDYKEFLKTHSYWIFTYALYKVLKKKFHSSQWQEWPQEYRHVNNDTLESLQKIYKDEMQFYCFLQYLAFSQWDTVRTYAQSKHIFLKGDIPILVNYDSADVWSDPLLFFTDLAAGAPPDMYSKEGQFWGFPLYHWPYHKKTGYTFWKNRLKAAELLYDIFRIDHIVGFFRIWAIPRNKKAIDGFFLPYDEQAWESQGKELLQMMLTATSMVPIGEDLGSVPNLVRNTMDALGIAGTKVLRWEKNWHGDVSFIHPKHFSRLSLATVSTHDSETLGQWWQDFPEEAKLFDEQFNCEPTFILTAKKRTFILELCHSAQSIFHINLLQEYLALFPELSWDTPQEERINIPGLVIKENWTYRFRPFIEDILEHVELKNFLKRLSASQFSSAHHNK